MCSVTTHDTFSSFLIEWLSFQNDSKIIIAEAP